MNVAHLEARHHLVRRPQHVARLDPVAFGGGEVHLDLHMWDHGLELNVQIDHALDALHRLLHLLRRRAEDVQLWPIEAHDDRFSTAREHLSDAFLQIGLHIAVDARVAVHHLLNGVERRVVVGPGIDAHPVLGEINPDRLIRHQGAADVRAEVPHALDGPQLLAGLDRDPVHLRMGGAGLGQPVHQEVPLLERREQLFPELRHHDDAGQHYHADRHVGAPRPAHDSRH